MFTSNVDGQFQQAGCDAARIVECHGTIEIWHAMLLLSLALLLAINALQAWLAWRAGQPR